MGAWECAIADSIPTATAIRPPTPAHSANMARRAERISPRVVSKWRQIPQDNRSAAPIGQSPLLQAPLDGRVPSASHSPWPPRLRPCAIDELDRSVLVGQAIGIVTPRHCGLQIFGRIHIHLRLGRVLDQFLIGNPQEELPKMERWMAQLQRLQLKFSPPPKA